MNAEVLHAAAKQVVDDLAYDDIRTRVTTLRNALDAAIASPSDDTSLTVATAFGALRAALEGAPSNRLPPADIAVLEEMGVIGLLGNSLLKRIEDVFSRNQITLSVARDELVKVDTELDQLQTFAAGLVAGLVYFKVPADDLAPGDCEVRVTIPRRFVNNDVGDLGVELERWRKIVGPFQELASGSRSELPIRLISTSDINISFQTGILACLIVGKATQWLLDRYKTLLEIRKLRDELRDLGMPREMVEMAEATATERIEEAIDATTNQLLEEYGANIEDHGRSNELKNELRRSVEQIAHRIDMGLQIMVRAEPPEIHLPDDAPEQERLTAVQEIEVYAEIRVVSEALKFEEVEGEGILSLSAGMDAEPPDPGDVGPQTAQ